MTHVCANSTARAAFNLGYRPTVVANATATRSLPNPLGGDVPAAQMQTGALAALADIFAIVVPSEDRRRPSRPDRVMSETCLRHGYLPNAT